MKKPVIIISLILAVNCGPRINYNQHFIDMRVSTGLEVFLSWHARNYRGMKAALVTNHSGVNFKLMQNFNLFKQKGITIKMILAPEHGIYGYKNEIDTYRSKYNRKLQTTVYNLYEVSNRKLKNLFKEVDIVIFDIQDMGMRCYTYISNLKTIMDVLNDMPTKLIVLDRPNPIGFLRTDGFYLEKRFQSKYISAFPAPFIYNMTIGEAALYYKGEFKKNVNLKVIRMMDYYREMLYNRTGLPWVPPSPNLPTYESSIIYTAIVLMEGINISVGRGTTKPFEFFGAPWIEPTSFSDELNKLGLKNFKFRPVYFVPTFSKYKGRRCGGVHIFYTGGRFSPTEVSYKIIGYIMKNYRQARWERYRSWYDIDSLAGTDKFRLSIKKEKPFKQFRADMKRSFRRYARRRRRYLLY